MDDRDAAIRQIVRILIDSAEDLSGRRVAALSRLSPSLATKFLKEMEASGLVSSRVDGRSIKWAPSPAAAPWLTSQDVGAVSRTLVVLTAVPLEHKAVTGILVGQKLVRTSKGLRFTRGRLIGKKIDWDVYVANVGMGNVQTASVVGNSLEELGASLVAFVGTAGGLKPGDQVHGDVVVAAKVYYAHGGKQIASLEGSKLLTRPSALELTPPLLHLAKAAIQNSGWSPAARRRGSFKAFVLPIASVEAVQTDPNGELLQTIKNTYNDAAALDMESYGLFRAADLHRVSALSVRGISDFIDDKNSELDESRQPIAAKNAGTIFALLLDEAHPDDIPSVNYSSKPPDVSTGAARTVPAYLQPWERRLRAVSESTAEAALEEVPLRADDAGIATWLNRVLHRPPKWLREESTGAAWALVAAAVGAATAKKAPAAYEQAAAASSAFGDQAMAEVYELFSAASLQNETMVAALSSLEPRVSPSFRPLVAFFGHASKSDVQGMTDAAPGALVACGQDPSLIGLPTDDVKGLKLEIGSEVLDILAYNILSTLATAWLLPGSISALAGAGPPTNPVLKENVQGALKAADRAVDIRPDLPAARLLVAQAQMAELQGQLNGRPDLPDATLRLRIIEESALGIRDLRRSWGVPTGEALALASYAHAFQGDPGGALRMILPPPDGFATPAEAASQDVSRVGAAIAIMNGRRELAIQLSGNLVDSAERALLQATAFESQSTMRLEAIESYKLALGSAQSKVSVIFRALHGLARLGVDPIEDETLLGFLGVLKEELDESSIDLIRANLAVAQGEYEAALAIARLYPDSEIATEIRVDALIGLERREEAAAMLDSHGLERGDLLLRQRAMRIAVEAGLTETSRRIAMDLSAASDGELRGEAIETRLILARSDGNWVEQASLASQLLNLAKDSDSDASTPSLIRRAEDARWYLAEALYFQRKHGEAFRVLREPAPQKVQQRSHAQLLLSIIRRILDDTLPSVPDGRLVEDLLEVAFSWPDDSDIAGLAFGILITLPAASLSGAQVMRARQFTERFLGDAEASQGITKIPVENSDLSQLNAYLRDTLGPREDALQDAVERISNLEFPQAVLAEITGRPSASTLIRCDLGFYPAIGEEDPVQSVKDILQSTESRSRVVVDTSALVIGPKIAVSRRHLFAYFDEILFPASLRRDVEQARSSLALRSTGSLGWNSREGRATFTVIDSGLVEGWAVEGQELVEDIRLLKVTPDVNADLVSTWDAAIALAQSHAVPLWSDDVATRRIARSMGLFAFGTVDLLAAMGIDAIALLQNLPPNERISHRIVDVPIARQWAQLAYSDDWSLDGYLALSISRASAWRDPGASMRHYRELIVSLPAESSARFIAGWAGTAANGLTHRSPVSKRPNVAGALLAWTALATDPAFSETGSMELDATAASFAGLESGSCLNEIFRVGEFLQRRLFPAGDAMHHVIATLTEALRSTLDRATASRVMALALAGVDPEFRTRAFQIFLTSSGVA